MNDIITIITGVTHDTENNSSVLFQGGDLVIKDGLIVEFKLRTLGRLELDLDKLYAVSPNGLHFPIKSKNINNSF